MTADKGDYSTPKSSSPFFILKISATIFLMSKAKTKFIIGIDEAGRGPLAGPITAAALCLPQNFRFLSPNFQKKLPLRDSKKLNSKQREEWFKCISNHPEIFYATASVSPRIIDKINITQAANLAATRALLKLVKRSNGLVNKTKVFLDGGLYLNSKFESQNSKLQLKNFKYATIIKGDEKIPAIMLASIVAKVTRDRKMKALHKRYPQYGFDEHKGYGTKKHRQLIRKHGLSVVHRRSFRIKK